MGLFIGIDPGKKGAVAVLKTDGTVHALEKMPETPKDFSYLKYSDVLFAVVEQMVAASWGGAPNNAELMRNYGWCEMWLSYQEIPYETKMARVWQKDMGCLSIPPKPVNTMNNNERSYWYKAKKLFNKKKAQQLFPNVKVFDWNADALLIAEYCRRIFKRRE